MSPILTGAPAEAQLQNVQVVTDFDVSAPQYPLIRLSADDFELLNYALFKVSAPAGNSTIWDSVAWMLRGADAGRDLVLFRAEKLVVSFNANARFKSIVRRAPRIIKSILFTVADDSLPPIEPGLTYYLALASENRRNGNRLFSKTRGHRQVAKRICQPMLRGHQKIICYPAWTKRRQKPEKIAATVFPGGFEG